uniref:Galectin n=1 Tax=Pygocentrus nattereri TaxID=42514 RepID=A0A3B4BV80_PYGNA
VFNAFQNGSWEGEEKVKHLPFHKGHHFELIIVVTVNGKNFYLFQHRMPPERVCALEIGGDVSVDTINITGVMGLQPIFNPGIPYSDMMPGGMTFKRTIIIRGMVPYGADSCVFCINFVASEGIVVRNSLIGGCWGEEEQDIDFNPFLQGQFFEVRTNFSDAMIRGKQANKTEGKKSKFPPKMYPCPLYCV